MSKPLRYVRPNERTRTAVNDLISESRMAGASSNPLYAIEPEPFFDAQAVIPRYQFDAVIGPTPKKSTELTDERYYVYAIMPRKQDTNGGRLEWAVNIQFQDGNPCIASNLEEAANGTHLLSQGTIVNVIATTDAGGNVHWTFSKLADVVQAITVDGSGGSTTPATYTYAGSKVDPIANATTTAGLFTDTELEQNRIEAPAVAGEHGMMVVHGAGAKWLPTPVNPVTQLWFADEQPVIVDCAGGASPSNVTTTEFTLPTYSPVPSSPTFVDSDQFYSTVGSIPSPFPLPNYNL